GKVVVMLIIFGAAMAFFAILQRLARPDGIYGIRQTPQAISMGPFVNQHHFAAFMNVASGITLGFLFGKDTPRDRRILLATAVVVMGAAIVLTGSRGGLLAFASVITTVLIFNYLVGKSARKRSESPGGLQRKIAIASGVVALVAVMLGLVLYLGGTESLLRGIGVAETTGGVSSGRTHYWSVALRV
ncbi:MAG: O-antigen ligase family protein, partial [Pyrinomonadaceae bacterium]